MPGVTVAMIRRGRKGGWIAESSHEGEEASIIVRTDALLCERSIVGWVLDNLEVRVSVFGYLAFVLISPFLGAASAHRHRRIC